MPWLFVLCAVTAALMVSSGFSQDKQDDKAVGKGTLPANWKKLGLTADQSKKILAIRASYAAKLDDLKKQIEKLKAEDDAECLKILTDDQKTQLKKILTDKIDGGKDKERSPQEGDNKKEEESADVQLPDITVFRRQDE
jgi:hypothetical protein